MSGASNLINSAGSAAGGLVGGAESAAQTAGNAIIQGGASLSNGIIQTASSTYDEAGTQAGKLVANAGGDGGILDGLEALAVVNPVTAPVSIGAGIVGTAMPGVLSTVADDAYQFGDNLYAQVIGANSGDQTLDIGSPLIGG